jgi:hypothetical protein
MLLLLLPLKIHSPPKKKRSKKRPQSHYRRAPRCLGEQLMGNIERSELLRDIQLVREQKRKYERIEARITETNTKKPHLLTREPLRQEILHLQL